MEYLAMRKYLSGGIPLCPFDCPFYPLSTGSLLQAIMKRMSLIQLLIKYNLIITEKAMNSVVPSYSAASSIYSIASLSLVVPVLFIFRQYFRSLDFMQMSYIFALAMYPTAFSSKLSTSFVNFQYNILTFCSSPDLVCTLGFPLSFGIVVAGFLVLVAIFLGLVKCCRSSKAEFQPTYTAFKGFFKWIYLPMTYYSAAALASALDRSMNMSNTNQSNLTQAGVVAVICLLFPIFQLIGYKCIQTEETLIWRKWLEFFSYIRLMATGTLLGLYAYFGSDIYLHCVMITLILYPFIHIWKEEFKYPIAQRIVFGLGEAAFLSNFFIFKYGPQYIQSYDLDFFFLGFVLLIDIFLYLIRSCRIGCYGINETSTVIPEKVPTSPMIKKQKTNKYEHDSGQELNNSRELSVSIRALNKKASPKK